jgi:hypothetical protein
LRSAANAERGGEKGEEEMAFHSVVDDISAQALSRGFGFRHACAPWFAH